MFKLYSITDLGDKQCKDNLSGNCNNGNCANIGGQRRCICKPGFAKNSNNYCAG